MYNCKQIKCKYWYIVRKFWKARKLSNENYSIVQFQTGNMIVEAKQTRKLIKRTSKSRQGLCSLLVCCLLKLPLLHRLVTKVGLMVQFYVAQSVSLPIQTPRPQLSRIVTSDTDGRKGLVVGKLRTMGTRNTH